MNDHLEKQLIECLDALEQGENLDTILARYPENAGELRGYLETAVSLQSLNIQPSLAAQQSSKSQFLETAAALGENKGSAPFVLRLQQILLPLAGFALFLFVITAVLIPVSARSVPGDTLYETKQFFEEVRLNLTSNAAGKLQLIEQYNQERIAEINILLVEGRQESVSFQGLIQEINEDSWVIAGLNTQLTENTVIEGAPEIGLTAIVTGETRDGALFAFTITIPNGGKPAPEVPLPSATPTTTATATETSVTPTVTPTASVTNTPTPSATMTETPIATPTATETALPTETTTAVATSTILPTIPPSNDNDNDNENDDNSNDNDNENEGDGENNNEDNENDDNNDNRNENDNDNENDDNSNDDGKDD